MSAYDEVTLGELYRVTLAQTKTLDEIRNDVKAQNGRVGTLEVGQREHEVRIATLNREVFDRPRRNQPSDSEPSDKDRRITERDVRMLLAGATGLTGVVVTLWKLLPLLLKALAP